MTLEATCRDAVTEIFLDEASKVQDPLVRDSVELLRKKIYLCGGITGDKLSVANPDIETFVGSIPKHLVATFAHLDAKLIDILWRTRRISSMFLLNELMVRGGVHNGDKFGDVLSRLRKNNVPADKVQRLVDDALLWPSLTTHPTNPTSLAYTRRGLVLDGLLSDPNTSPPLIRAALRELIATPMDEMPNQAGARRKTPEMEGEELLLFLESIYSCAAESVFALREALATFGYESVRVNRLIDVHVWGPGDGDGNPNMTAASLNDFLGRTRKRLIELYLAEFNSIPSRDVPKDVADQFRASLQSQDSVKINSAFAALQPYEAASRPVASLLIKHSTFSMHFAGIDIRHNSRDIMTTVARLLEVTDGIGMDDFLGMSVDNQASIIRSRLADPSIRSRTLELGNFDELKKSNNAAAGQTAHRVFSRMLVVAANPSRFNKFIIAETTSIANVLGALLLLHCAGVGVMRAGSPIDVVPLFESRADLRAAPMMVHQLLVDPAFGANVTHRGYLLAMIAKSDTARLSGAGVQGAQEETIGQLLAMNPENYNGKRVFVMLGGGDDQMRGGGRIVESPHVVLRAEAREGGKNPARLAMTIQGMQLQLVFGCRILTNYFTEGVAAHLILSNARIQGLVPWRAAHASINEIAAARQAHLFFNTAMDRYESQIGTDAQKDATRRTLVDYLNCFPAEIIEWTNKSSRPGARQKTSDPFQGRAISLDQRAKHDGAYLTATIGLHDAMMTLASQLRCGNASEHGLMEAHRHAYAGNKSFRDFARMQATVLYQKDYDFAWALRGGTPTFIERQQLEAAFVQGGYNPPRVFLAKLQAADLQLAFLLVVAISGKRPAGAVELKAPLKAGWPELAAALDARERLSIVAKRLQLKAARRINDAKALGGQDLQAALSAHRDLGYFAYVGTNPALSSPNFSLTLTDPFKEDGLPLLSESNPSVQVGSLVPKWAKGVSKL